jgi:replication-associated recombination protein RarA
MIKDINAFMFHDQETKDQIMMLIDEPNIFPAYRQGIIFYGDYGTGKTTLAGLMTSAIDNARGCSYDFGADLALKCSARDYGTHLKQIDAMFDRNICRYAYRYYVIFDEFDLYGDKQNQFKSVMTDPRIGFFITTNNLSSIEPAIKSRCHTVELKPPPAALWNSYIKQSLSDRDIAVTDQEISQLLSCTRSLAPRDVKDIIEKFAYQKKKAA